MSDRDAEAWNRQPWIELRTAPGCAFRTDPWCRHCGWIEMSHVCHVTEMTADEECVALAELNAVTAHNPATVTHVAEYCGGMEWRTPSGWLVQVFNDCCEWDYLQRLIAPDGREWEFPFQASTLAMTDRIADWTPDPENYAGWPRIEVCPP